MRRRATEMTMVTVLPWPSACWGSPWAGVGRPGHAHHRRRRGPALQVVLMVRATSWC